MNADPIAMQIERSDHAISELVRKERLRELKTSRPVEYLDLAAGPAGVPSLDYIARGLRLVRGDRAILGGPAGSGKSTLAVGLSVAIASGTPFLGARTGDGEPVIYFDGEAGAADMTRIFRRFGAAEIPNLHVCTDSDLSLVDRDSVKRQEREILEKRPALVVYDTVTSFMRGVNKNDAGEVAAIYNILHRLSAEYSCAFLLLHHLNKAPREGRVSTLDRLRGSTVHTTQPSLVLTCEPVAGALDVACLKRRGGRREDELARVRLVEDDGPDGMLQLENIGQPESVEASLDVVSRAIIDMVTPGREMKRKQIVDALKDQHDERAIDRALRHLAGVGALDKPGTAGWYRLPEKTAAGFPLFRGNAEDRAESPLSGERA